MPRLEFSYVKSYIEENSNCKLLSTEYKNNTTPLDLQCGCGKIFTTNWARFKSNNQRQCIECSYKDIRYNYDFVKEYVESQGYEMISVEYINVRNPITVKCPNGHQYNVAFNSFKFGKRCKQCQSHQFSFVKEYVESFDYKLLSSSYETNSEKLTFQCNKGHIYESTFAKFKDRQHRCPVCKGINTSDRQRKDFGEVKKMFSAEGYKVISDKYINNKSKLLVECPSGHQYKVTSANFITGYRCPKCTESTGEKAIRLYLEKYNIPHEQEYGFENLRGKLNSKFLFDFAVLNPDNSIKLLIEYDGEQHFIPKDFFGGEQGLIKTQKRDNIKNNYCEENKIPLLRIPYTEFENIENILQEHLS